MIKKILPTSLAMLSLQGRDVSDFRFVISGQTPGVQPCRDKTVLKNEPVKQFMTDQFEFRHAISLIKNVMGFKPY